MRPTARAEQAGNRGKVKPGQAEVHDHQIERLRDNCHKRRASLLATNDLVSPVTENLVELVRRWVAGLDE